MRLEKEEAEKRAKEAQARVSQLEQEVENVRRTLASGSADAEELSALQRRMSEKEELWAEERRSFEDRIADLEKHLEDLRRARQGDGTEEMREMRTMEKKLLAVEDQLEEERQQ